MRLSPELGFTLGVEPTNKEEKKKRERDKVHDIVLKVLLKQSGITDSKQLPSIPDTRCEYQCPAFSQNTCIK